MKYSDNKIEFNRQNDNVSPHKYVTHGAKQWLETLKLHWKLSVTTMSENDTDVLVMFYEQNKSRRSVYVANYDKSTKVGVIYDRRKEIRVEA